MDRRRSKILCTLGPATSSREALERLVDAGLDAVRVNFSHGAHETHADTVALVRGVSADRGRPIAILADLQGPKIRLGMVPDEGVMLETGAEV